MSIRVVTAVWDGSSQKGAALLLLLAIADFAHDDGTGAYPSHLTLSQKTRLHPDSVRRLIKEVERSGELSMEIGAGPRGVNVYRVHLDRLGRGGVSYGGDLGVPPGHSVGEGGTSCNPPRVTENPPKPLVEPLVNRKNSPPPPSQQPIGGLVDQWETLFSEFYAAYPRRTGRADALRAWMKIRNRDELQFRVIMDSVRNYVAALGPNPDLKYVPHPATWLNGERYFDDPKAAAASARPKMNGGTTEAPVPVPPPDNAPVSEMVAWLRNPESARHPMFRGADGQRRRREELARYTTEENRP